MSVSSAYCRIGKSWSFLRGIGSLKSPSNQAAFRRVWRKSAANTNKRGERRSPCLTPLMQWKTLPGTPFRRTAEVPVLKICCIHCSHFSGKHFALIICNISWCSTLSNAFSKSSFQITSSFFDWWHMWRYSRAHARQSCIALCLIKPYWFLCIKEGKISCNLLARTLVMILIELLKRDMGLKSETFSGSSFLGMRAMYEPLMLCRQICPLWKSSKSL